MSNFVEYTEPDWRGLNMRELAVDHAYFSVISEYAQKTHLYMLSDDCYTCPFKKLEKIPPAPSPRIGIPIKVTHPLKFKLFENDQGRYAFDNETALCELKDDYLMQEFGVYNLTIASNGTCSLVTDKDGVNVNLSLLSMFVLVALIFTLVRMTLCAWKTFHYESHNAADAAAPAAVEGTTPKKRMRSLDAFRGLAIVLMIFVNSGGGEYWWIEHAPWNGLHLADIVFPSFLWIMGVCIPISVRSQLSRGTPKPKICSRIAVRSIKLFLIGVCLNSVNGPKLEDLRIMGVLQRFGVAYFVCGLVHTIFIRKEYIVPQDRWRSKFFDLILFRGELITSIALTVVSLSMTFALNVPGCPKGYIGPGGMDSYAQYLNCTGGAAAFIDRQLLGNHIYQRPTARALYDAKPFDPEGVFGCLLTIGQVFIGVLCGLQILIFNDSRSRIRRWIGWAIVFGLLGGILCNFSKESGVIPLNKNLWSLSFVLVMTSLAFVMLSFLYYIIDVKQWYSGFPFVESGMNAIIMYVGHTIAHKMLPWHWRIGSMNTHFVLLLESLWNTFIWVGIALYLDARNFYYSL